MIGETGTSVFIFGNKEDKETGEIIEADGCIQEYEIARKNGNIIIPVGSTGYAAKTILEKIKADIKEFPYLESYLSVLETETNIEKIVETILCILEKQTY